MAEPSTGLRVLEREAAPARRWATGLGFLAALAAGALAFAAARAWPAFGGLAPLQRLRDSSQLDEAAAGLLALAAGLAVWGFASARRLVRAGGLARQQKALLDAIVASVPDAVVVADGRGRFRANAAAVRLFALPAPSGSSAVLHDAFARLDRRNPATGHRIPPGAGVLEAALAGRATSMDEVMAAPEGARTLRVAGSPIPFARGATGGLILASDVTDRLAVQAALQSAKDLLEQKNAQHLRMARAIAHDLGNAITPAELHVHILGTSKGDLKRSLPVLSRSVAQMQRLVGDLSDLARLESGAMKVMARHVGLDEAIAATVASLQPRAEEKALALAAEPAGSLAVHADPERLGQVLSNFIGNAVKFTPSGGSVRVGAAREGGMMRISVTDTGMGLDGAQMARLFKPFSQVHDPLKVKERGTGLGLYICKGLVEAQGGQVGVSSPGPGHGSTFWFTLPLAP